ncbi:MAG: ATP-binding protein, partial [bacterium]|nr:ATP-binding protein [bacterium]
MELFNRKQNIENSLAPKRVLVIYGSRRVGKTTILKKYLSTQKGRILYSTGDDISIRQIFESEQRVRILNFAESYDIIGIDEAQQIPRVGLGIKMIIDEFPDKNIILTGSSSFDLSREVGEPLTGRHFELLLLPIAQEEIGLGKFELENQIEKFLLYGSYPEVLLQPDSNSKTRILKELVSSYLFKDVLALDRIKSPSLLLDITKYLAFQIGNEVSHNEIAKTVGANTKTVARYIDLLEKMFVIKKVRGYSRNLRNEISKKSKYYFIDLGIRNAVIANFNPLDTRDDVGGLWENFIFMELFKKRNAGENLEEFYFWRTHSGQEIDIIRDSEKGLEAFEVKWKKDKVKEPGLWRE